MATIMNHYDIHQGSIEALFLRSINWLDEQHVKVQKLSVAVGNEVVLDFYKRFNFHPLHIVLQRKQ